MRLLITFLVIQNSFLSYANQKKTWSYSFLYPMTVSQSCETAAPRFAEGLAAATGVKVHRYYCEQDVGYSKMTLRYDAVEELNSASERDIYPTYEDCQKDLTRRKDLYEKNTGLSPFFAFCALPFRSNSPFGKPNYSADLFIDGFGSPKEKPSQLKMEVVGNPVKKETVSDIYRALESLKVLVSQVGAVAGITISYYGTRNLIYFDHQFGTTQMCQERAEDFKDFSKDSPALISAFCTWDPESWGRPQAHLYSLWESTGVTSFSATVVEKKYRDFGSCHADRPRVLESMKATEGKKMLGALCSLDRDYKTYSLWAFTRTGID